jgi:hypothetical protein
MGALGGVNQDACCATFRRFLSARIGEQLSIGCSYREVDLGVADDEDQVKSVS